MNQIILVFIAGFLAFVAGTILGYYVRQSLAKKRKGTIEAKLQKKLEQVKKEAEDLVAKSKEEAERIVSQAQKERDERRKELLQTEQMLFNRERVLDNRISSFESKEKEFAGKLETLKQAKEKLMKMKEQVSLELERVAGMNKKQAQEEIIKEVEKDSEQEILEKIHRLKNEGSERYETLAKEIIATAVQRCALSQAQEITTSTVSLPSEEVKGRIIGKEGRNIKTFEKMSGVEVIVDDTPEAVVISGFNPLRRHIAKVALEQLIKDGRIQPARIEEQIEKARQETQKQVKEFGEKAIFETGIVDLQPKIVELLGRLYFRTSYGQNVLMHSVEVSLLAGILAEEIGVNVRIAKKAGLLHDIGKALDHQVQGSHVDIGVKVLEKFGEDDKVIKAMKSHHGEYEAENIEAIIVQAADQISGARPGARKDTVENYLNRLKELEDLAMAFAGISSAYAIQAGREIRVFVKPEEVGDLEAYKLAKDIAKRVQEELHYPGEIKVTLIRETRVIEYAK